MGVWDMTLTGTDRPWRRSADSCVLMRIDRDMPRERRRIHCQVGRR